MSINNTIDQYFIFQSTSNCGSGGEGVHCGERGRQRDYLWTWDSLEGEKLCFLRAGTTRGEGAPEMWGEAGRRAVGQGVSQMHCSISGVYLGQRLKAGPSYQPGKHIYPVAPNGGWVAIFSPGAFGYIQKPLAV